MMGKHPIPSKVAWDGFFSYYIHSPAQDRYLFIATLPIIDVMICSSVSTIR
jgi:hypothetical protein